MCSGENSVPTWPFHCFDKSILTIDRSPELTAVTPRPSVKNTPDGSILESRAPTTPVALRPVSASHAPAVVSAPGAQFRKDCWLFQKSSFDRRLWAYKKFFRNWGPGEDFAGEYNAPGLPGITGSAGTLLGDADGAFFRQTLYPPERDYPHGVTLCFSVGMDASRCSPIYGRETTVMPPSINQPAILYLGRPA